MFYYAVAVPLPRLEPLTYSSADVVQAGTRVLVPLGKRTVTGIVVHSADTPNRRILPIAEVLEHSPSIPPSVLELTKRVAEYYLCSWGEALFAALPPGLQPSTVVRVELLPQSTPINIEEMRNRAPRRAALLDVLLSSQSHVTVGYLQRRLKHANVAQQLDALQRDGIIAIHTDVDEQYSPRLTRAVALAEEYVTDSERLKSVFDELDRKAPKQSLVLGQIYQAHVQHHTPVPISQLTRSTNVSPSVVEALIAKGVCTVQNISIEQQPTKMSGDLVSRNEAELNLNTEQLAAVERLVQAMNSTSEPGNATKTFLLHGITGSGKTVVYQHAIRHALNRGTTCLMLVPEISLTPQLHDRFHALFADRVAVLHSAMGPGHRARIWERIQRGTVKVVGARSAVFAPIRDLGLIIVDEEHEPSYKQEDPAPRYQGRDVAVLRGSIERCPIVLGSATPSLESLYNVQIGKYELLTLSKRADGASLPTVRCVNITEERRKQRMTGTVSDLLAEAVVRHVQQGDSAILFLNRRGYATQLVCEDCGTALRCPHCDVNLTWHKQPGLMRCCGHTEPVPSVCTTCGGIEMRESGIGVQRVVEDLVHSVQRMNTSLNRPLVIERMDADSMKSQAAHRKVLERFARGDIDVLVGTQMVAKGLDLPRVRLVGVIRAEQSLHHLDFRAAERTVQLLIQVFGRAGRTANRAGEVIVQAYEPMHPSIHAAVTNTFTQWTSAELDVRSASEYPPFTRFCVIECSGATESDVERAAEILSRLIPVESDIHVRFSAQKPPVAWIRHRHRRVIVIKGRKQNDASGSGLRYLLRDALQRYYREYAVSSVRVTVDIDAHGHI